MYNKRNDNGTYITSFKSESKQFEEKNQINAPTNFNSLDKIKNYKTIESSPFIHNKKLSSVIFPLIKQKHKNKNVISILFDSSRKSLNKIQKKNLLNISKIKKRKNSNNKRKKCLQLKFNNNSIDKINKKNNLNTIDTSLIKKEKNKRSIIHNIKSAKTIKTLFINNLKFNQIKNNQINNSLSPKKSFDYLLNSSSSRNNKINLKKRFKSILDEFKKKEKILEGSKKLLYLYSLKSFSPRLLSKKGSKENNKIDNNLSRNNNYEHEKYKIHTMIFNNKCIPYLDGIDIRKTSTNLPPINLGARYYIPKKSIEIIKREKLNEAIDKIIKENNRIVNKKKLNLTKKAILQKFRNRNLQFCNNRIHKTEVDVNGTKNKIINNFDKLKLSLNEFDNWNSPENIDNLFG